MSNSIEDLDDLMRFKFAVAAGLYDKDLDVIVSTVQARRQLLDAQRNAELVASLTVGDRVRVQRTSPKLFNGKIGTVCGFDGERVKVDMGQVYRARTSSYTQVQSFLPSQLERV